MPDFLQADWGAMKAISGKTLKQIFYAININKSKELLLEGMTPDLLGEYFCLNHLEKSKLDNDEADFLQHFRNEAWRRNPQEFFSFLDRIADDYPDHRVVKMLFEQPLPLQAETVLYYAIFLFSLTYRDCIERSIWAKDRLEALYAEYPEIVLEYAKGLFNLSNAYSEIADKKTCIDKLEELAEECASTPEIVLVYAQGLVNLSHDYSEIADKKTCIDKLEELAEEYASTPEIVLVYAQGLFNLSHAYSEIADKKTCIDKLEELFAEHPEWDF